MGKRSILDNFFRRGFPVGSCSAAVSSPDSSGWLLSAPGETTSSGGCSASGAFSASGVFSACGIFSSDGVSSVTAGWLRYSARMDSRLISSSPGSSTPCSSRWVSIREGSYGLGSRFSVITAPYSVYRLPVRPDAAAQPHKAGWQRRRTHSERRSGLSSVC